MASSPGPHSRVELCLLAARAVRGAGAEVRKEWGQRDERRVLDDSHSAAGSGAHAGPRAWASEQRSESDREVDQKRWEAEM